MCALSQPAKGGISLSLRCLHRCMPCGEGQKAVWQLLCYSRWDRTLPQFRLKKCCRGHGREYTGKRRTFSFSYLKTAFSVSTRRRRFCICAVPVIHILQDYGACYFAAQAITCGSPVFSAYLCGISDSHSAYRRFSIL